MHIAILLPNLHNGGVERIRALLAKLFIAQGHSVTFVVLKASGELLEDVSQYANVVDLKTSHIRSSLKPLRHWIKANKPDAILAGMWPMTSLAVTAAIGTGCRVVVSDHCALSQQYKTWGRLHMFCLRASIAVTYRLATACVGVSIGVSRDLEHLGFLKADSMQTIYNPIRLSAVPDGDANTAQLWPATDPKCDRILAVGTLKAQKNYPLLINSFAQVLKTRKAHLTILGDGPLRSQIQDMITTLGLSDHVSMPGFVADPAPYYQSADLFTLTSDYEGFGNVIVEALGAGTSVVSTDCRSGPREILEDGTYGTLVPVRDEHAFAQAIIAALDRPHDPDILKKHAWAFRPEIAANAYLKLLAPDT